MSNSRTVSLVTLGCARNEVDSEELAARLAAGGWSLRGEGQDADVVLVNTCGFIEAAKKESIDTVMEAADSGAKVAAVGCLAERYGTELATALDGEDVDAQVLSFDDYDDIASRLDDVLVFVLFLVNLVERRGEVGAVALGQAADGRDLRA